MCSGCRLPSGCSGFPQPSPSQLIRIPAVDALARGAAPERSCRAHPVVKAGDFAPAGRRVGHRREVPTAPALNGAKVELLRNGQVIRATITDAAGRFAFEKVRLGVYEVRASADAAGRGHHACGGWQPARCAAAYGMGVPLQETDQAQSVFGMAGERAPVRKDRRQHSARSGIAGKAQRRGGAAAAGPVQPARSFPRRTSTPRRTTALMTTASVASQTSRSPLSRRT